MSLSLSDVSVRVAERTVLESVFLELARGTVAVLTGSNGSGKSSLANALMGHPNYSVARGTVQLDGEDITLYPPDKKARKGLFLSQQHTPRIGGVTLATFLHKAYETVHCREVPALEAYLSQKKIAASLGLDESLLDRPLTATLSGGERKQSEVLQLAVLTPKYAILDEIDSGVDRDALTRVFRAIQELRSQGTGIIIISHHPDAVRYAQPDMVYTVEGKTIRIT